MAIIFSELDIKEEPLDYFRLGKMKNTDKDRPILIKMKTERCCYEILKQSNQLRNSKDKEVNNIAIRKDLTVRQREMNKKLTEELKRRRYRGETDIKIKNGKIVKITNEGASSQNYVMNYIKSV